jgi:hypothetical protein
MHRLYPTLFKQAKREVVNEFSLLMTVQGTNDSMRPALTMCHCKYVETMYVYTYTCIMSMSIHMYGYTYKYYDCARDQ